MIQGTSYKNKMNESIVGIFKTEYCYYPPKKSFFRPDKDYPELTSLNMPLSSEKNHVYEAVREALYLAGFDATHFGTPDWNPFAAYIKKKDTVLIKPNLVMDKNHNQDGGTDCLYTHPSVVAPIIDYVLLALGCTGRIIIGDAPMQECNFDSLIENSGYKQLVEFYKNRYGCNIRLVDFRQLSSVVINGIHHFSIDESKEGMIINLGKDSVHFQEGEQSHKIRITNYDPRILRLHHYQDKHEYFISSHVLNADVLINIPKPKVHRKAGMTISLKNMIGINVRKEFLPHHTMGAISQGGDEYKDKNLIHSFRSYMLDKKNIYVFENKYGKARLAYIVIKCLSRILELTKNDFYREGNWYGNDTISKTIVDLNRIVQYADKNGVLQANRTRKMIIVADMIIAGEKEGPVAPSPKELGIIAAGTNPVCFDEIIATLVGFDYHKIPSITRAREANQRYALVDQEVKPVVASNLPDLNGSHLEQIPLIEDFILIPTSGWKSHIER